MKKALKYEGIDVNATLESFLPPLPWAVEWNRVEIVKLLLANEKVDVNVKVKYGLRPLYNATSHGYSEIVRLLLLDERIDPNAKADYGYTPLMIANNFTERAYQKNNPYISIVTMLLSHPAIDVNITDDWGRTALIHALEHRTIAQLLGQDERTDLTKIKADIKLLKQALPYCSPAVLNKQTSHGRTPLIFAVLSNNVELVSALLKNSKVDISIQDTDGETALTYAVTGENRKIAELLLKANKDNLLARYRLNGNEVSLFELVVAKGTTAIAEKLLFSKDYDINDVDANGLTPIMIASKYGKKSLVVALLKNPQLNLDKGRNHGAALFAGLSPGEVLELKQLYGQYHPVWSAQQEEQRLQALPKAEQRALYREELLAALKAENYPLAVKNFKRFEGLGDKLPASFQFHYGKALLNLGEQELAREKFVDYLVQSGPQGRYAREAQEFCDQLK